MKKRMKMNYKYVLLFLFAIANISAQEEDLEKAEKKYKTYASLAAEEIEKGEFAQAEALYRKALDKNPKGDEAAYNFGNLYFENQKNRDSAFKYLESAKASENESVKHRNYHNLGNLMMEEKDYARAVEAYKNALRNIPTDEETRYNLAIAKKKLEKEKQNGGDGEDENKDQQKDKKEDKKEEDKEGEGDNKDKKEDQKQDSKEGDKEKENKQPKDDAKKDPKNGDKEQQKQPSEPKQQKGKMSEQQVKNLLQAIENKEKNTQEKLNAKKVKGAKVKTEKDW